MHVLEGEHLIRSTRGEVQILDRAALDLRARNLSSSSATSSQSMIGATVAVNAVSGRAGSGSMPARGSADRNETIGRAIKQILAGLASVPEMIKDAPDLASSDELRSFAITLLRAGYAKGRDMGKWTIAVPDGGNGWKTVSLAEAAGGSVAVKRLLS